MDWAALNLEVCGSASSSPSAPAACAASGRCLMDGGSYHRSPTAFKRIARVLETLVGRGDTKPEPRSYAARQSAFAVAGGL